MDKKQPSPPKLALKLLAVFLREDFLEEVSGDLEEDFLRVVEHQSVKKAKFNYWYQVINYIRPFALKKTQLTAMNRLDIFKHYIKISWRNILRNKVFSAIEIGGLTIGITSCILLALYVKHQGSYDTHYQDSDRIFRIVNQWSESGEVGRWSNVHGPLKPVLEDNIPEMEKVARIVVWSWGDAGENHIRSIDAKYNSYEKGFIYADPELLNILEVSMVYGQQELALDAPNQMVISRTKANQYFPGKDPVGLRMILNDNPSSTFTIGGVFEDFPENSHLQADFIMTLKDRKEGPGTSDWCCTNYNMYVKLKEGSDKVAVEEKTLALRNSFVLDQLRTAGETGLTEMEKYQSYYLQPIGNVYLNPELVQDNLPVHGSEELNWILSFIGFIILALAGINFVNLATAKSLKRAKEVGLRKVVGSFRASLLYQYLAESCLYSFLATGIGLLLAIVTLPAFNQLAETSLFIPWSSPWFILSLLVGAVVVGILSGIYPAFYLSKFSPVEALKGLKTQNGGKTSTMKGLMVILQFTATIILIICASVSHLQFRYMMDKPLGYEKENVVNIVGLETFSRERVESFKQELLKLPAVESATSSDYLPVLGSFVQNRTFWEADRRQLDNGFEAARWAVDEDYLSTMGMQMVAGRNFNPQLTETQSIIVNEQMAASLGGEDIVGLQVIDMFDEKYRIIGIVQDFHFESLIHEIRPLAMVLGKGKATLSVKVNETDTQETIKAVSGVWDDFSNQQSLRYSFMDERFARMYEDFKQVKSIFLVFSLLSLFIACIGLFALSVYLVEQRSKEMSVRKILGASVSKVFTLLVFDFLKWVVLSIVIAIPISWYFLDEILSHFPHSIQLTWPIFVGASVAGLAIAFITTSIESFKAAVINPARRLRSE